MVTAGGGEGPQPHPSAHTSRRAFPFTPPTCTLAHTLGRMPPCASRAPPHYLHLSPVQRMLQLRDLALPLRCRREGLRPQPRALHVQVIRTGLKIRLGVPCGCCGLLETSGAAHHQSGLPLGALLNGRGAVHHQIGFPLGAFLKGGGGTESDSISIIWRHSPMHAGEAPVFLTPPPCPQRRGGGAD